MLQVGHLQRFNPAFQALAAQGGRPLFIDIERLAPFKARGTDVDVVLDLMIHDLDLVLALAQRAGRAGERERLSRADGRIDIANARIEFADGCIASVSASRVSQSPVRKLRVFRHDGYVSADLQEQRLRHVRKATADGIEESEQAFERADELRAQAEAFLRAVRERGAPLVSGEQGRAALALALQVGRLVEERLARHGSLTFTKMEGAGNDFVVLDFTKKLFALNRDKFESSPIAISASAATRSWWSRRPASPASISATASSTPTAARSSSAATARAASSSSCTRRGLTREARDPRRDPGRRHRAAAGGRRRGERRHGAARC